MSLLEMRSITKRFPGVLALDDVNLSLGSGEVLGLIGENGAGKSTLLKILGGVHMPDAGTVRIDGRELRFHTVRAAIENGISLIHQELNLAENLNVVANIFLGREPRRAGPVGWINRRTLRSDAETLCRRLQFDLPLDCPVAALSPGQKQMVEIAKAISVHARILVMDEPTSSLSETETERLFTVVRQLRESGMSVIYVTHRLWELERLADRVEVLRDGRNVGGLDRCEIDHDRMVRMMVGRDIQSFYQPHDRVGDEPVLEVRDLRWKDPSGPGINFVVRRGEILGMAGLVGAGRSETAEAIFGLRRTFSGRIVINGRPLPRASAKQAIAAGLGFVPEDRKLQGLVLEMSVKENISLAGLRAFSRSGLVDRKWQNTVTDRMIAKLDIKTPGSLQTAKLLSGGNQQKVVIGKWLALDLDVLIVDEPTRGIDVGAKAEIYALMKELTERGMGILMISSEMEELIHMADRLVVMHEGTIMGELSREQLSEEAIMHLATGTGTRADTKQPHEGRDHA